MAYKKGDSKFKIIVSNRNGKIPSCEVHYTEVVRVTHSQWDYAGHTWVCHHHDDYDQTGITGSQESESHCLRYYDPARFQQCILAGWYVSTNKPVQYRKCTSIYMTTVIQIKIRMRLRRAKGIRTIGEYVELRSEQAPCMWKFTVNDCTKKHSHHPVVWCIVVWALSPSPTKSRVAETGTGW